MNLIPLLQVSRSLVNGGSAAGRYRLVPAAPIPAFGGVGRRPSSRITSAAVEPIPVQEERVAAGNAVGVSSLPQRARLAKRSGARAAGPGASAALRPEGARRGTGRGWRKWLQPAAWVNWVRRANPFEVRNVASGVVPRQASLPLEGLRVARNDLADADLEVIPAGSPGGGWVGRCRKGEVSGWRLPTAGDANGVPEEACSATKSICDRV